MPKIFRRVDKIQFLSQFVWVTVQKINPKRRAEMFHKSSSNPSMETRRSQLNMLHFMEKERRDSKEFTFPEENALHRRRPSAQPVDSATQSEDDDVPSFEVRENAERETL